MGQDRFDLGALAQNLFTLEVNTIVKDVITAQKMPAPEQALIDVANDYRAWLRERIGVPAGLVEGAGPEVRAAVASICDRARDRRASVAVFDEIQGVAEYLGTRPPGGAGAHWRLIDRICGNADELKGLMRRLRGGEALELVRSNGLQPEAIDVAAEDMVNLRKIWDVGLEEIEAQTVIQLDGDVFLRLRSGLLESPHRQALLEVHDRSVKVSVDFWGQLVGLVGSFMKSLADMMRGGRP